MPKQEKNTKLYRLATKYTKWPQNRPNGHKINQHLQLHDPTKFTQIGIFGLKICHLKTLIDRMIYAFCRHFQYFFDVLLFGISDFGMKW
jgi:hypothetical protein